ncbi:hypothetical protein CVD19_17635 [Bacillus sp. T33-2]|nr:hypothetical protein CVD19_17635 [Bacillus sp. T33-2]
MREVSLLYCYPASLPRNTFVHCGAYTARANFLDINLHLKHYENISQFNASFPKKVRLSNKVQHQYFVEGILF